MPEGELDEPGNLGTIIKNNIVRLITDHGRGVRRQRGGVRGQPRRARRRATLTRPASCFRGNDNQVLYNLIRFSSQRGIVLERYFDATLDQDVPSSGNLIQGNLLTRNHTSGIHLAAGHRRVPQADDTTIDANIITLNDGEGVSIPEGDFDPPNQPAATDTTLTNNIFRDNRTDICNESDSTVIDASNDFTTGGLDTDCIVESGD